MKAITKHLTILLVALSSLVAFTACDDDDDDYGGDGRLYGEWELYSTSYGIISWDQEAEFDFYSNGNGTYSCYDEYGNWQDYPISWWADGTYLTVYLPTETWNYTYQFSGGYLYLYPDDSSDYLVFVPD